MDLAALGAGQMTFTDRGCGDGVLIAHFERDTESGESVLLDRGTRKVWPLFKGRQPLAGLALWALEGVTFPARDGQRLYGDLTRPDQTSDKLVPVIHGPPYARDFWAAMRCWLANRR